MRSPFGKSLVAVAEATRGSAASAASTRAASRAKKYSFSWIRAADRTASRVIAEFPDTS
jgi:hypothetical protein